MKNKILLICILALVSISASAQGLFVGYSGTDKALIGARAGGCFNKHFGISVTARADSKNLEKDKSKVVDSPYRVSYQGGVIYKPLEWMMISLNCGYGEKGLYGYSEDGSKFGIINKQTGLNGGLDLSFIFSKIFVSIGYETLVGKSVKFGSVNEISFGVGMFLDL